MIPEEVKQKIQDAFQEYIQGVIITSASLDPTRDRNRKAGFVSGAIFGYQLASSEIEELKREVERVKKLLEKEFDYSHRNVMYPNRTLLWNKFKTENNL